MRKGGSAAPSRRSSLVVVGPPGPRPPRHWNANEEVLAEYPTTDRVAVVPVPDALDSVTVVDADGQSLARRAPLETADLSD